MTSATAGHGDWEGLWVWPPCWWLSVILWSLAVVLVWGVGFLIWSVLFGDVTLFGKK